MLSFIQEDFMRERIKEHPCKEVLDYLFRPAAQADLHRSYQAIIAVNEAHVLMLAEQGIITRHTASAILKVNEELARMEDHPTFEIDLDKEDLYFNMEKYLIDKTGLHTGGQQHTARSRNDMLATITRLNTRKEFFALSQLFIDLRRALIAKAFDNLDAYMSGYTHLQPSEPSTFAAWLSAISSALERDYRRFSQAYASLNLSPLGGCAMASTSFPINRKMTASLLGFDDTVPNSIDCVAARDYALDIVSALSMMSLTLSRMAQDLYVWATPDFDYVEVGGSTAACSSIMPQKKNPITLEHIKAKAAHLEGFYISLFSAMKNVAYTHSRDISSESMRFLFTAIDEAKASMALTIPTIQTLQVKKDRMYQKAQRNFCTVTELANQLVRHGDFSFRAAHEIVGTLVTSMMDQHKTAMDIHLGDVDAVCETLFQKPSGLTEEFVFKALDPKENVLAKSHEGGSAPAEVSRQLLLLETQLANDEEELRGRVSRTEAAARLLQQKVTALCQ